jgi:hypothetical protein
MNHADLFLGFSRRRNPCLGWCTGRGRSVGCERLCGLLYCEFLLQIQIHSLSPSPLLFSGARSANRDREQTFNVIAANVCNHDQIPLAVAAYVIQGGLRSTFIADYIHTVILFVAIFIFAFTLYTTDDYVGSPSRFYDLLTAAAEASPLPQNKGGSWLTFQSKGGLTFAALIFLGSFSTVWLDQAYWQRAIASKPETSVKAYLLGGVSFSGLTELNIVSETNLSFFSLACLVWYSVRLRDRHGPWLRRHDRLALVPDVPQPPQRRSGQRRL